MFSVWKGEAMIKFYRPLSIQTEKLVTLKHFWILKLSLIICFALVSYFLGYYRGTVYLVATQQVAHDRVKTEYPVISYIQSGRAFVCEHGDCFYVNYTPTKSSGYWKKAIK